MPRHATAQRAPATAHDTSQRTGLRATWRRLNVPHAIEPATMRLSCIVFFVIYAIIVVSRSHGIHSQFIVSRLAVCGYALLGVWLARRATPRIVRVYAVGLGFVLPLQAAYVNGILGNGPGEVAITAIATFAPLMFLQTALDFVIVTVGVALGHTFMLSIVPEPELPIFAVAVMLGGAMAIGTVAGLQTLVYRTRWAQSLADIEHALASTAAWKNRFEAASLASGQILYDWSPDGDELRCGGAYDRILGYSLEELSGGFASWRERVHPDDRGDFEIETERAVATKHPLHLQYRMRRKDGCYIVVEHSGQFVLAPDGTIERLIGFVSDVTGRAAAEKARAEEAAISAALAHVGRELISSLATPVVLERLCRLTTEVLACDFSQTWIWNSEEQAYAAVSGYGLSNEEWEALRIIKIPFNPGTPVMEQLLRDDVVEVTRSSAEYPMVAGILAYYGFGTVLCSPLFRGRDLVGIQGTGYRNRTDAFTPVQRRVARGISQLASMAWTNAQLVEELERASSLKSEFVSTMSHELRTPLNVILGYTEMLEGTDLDDEQGMLLTRVRRSSIELLELIEATLDLNRIGSGKNAPRLERVSLATFWEELQSEFAALPPKAGVALRWEVAAGELQTDRRKLKMILKNLIGNALKFTPEGSVVVHCERRDDGCEFSVADTGIGIPEAQLPFIFDMFRQVDSSDARSFGGVGLGLYIVRQLVEQLGGEVRVESEPGRGSVFRVAIPDGRTPEAVAA